MTVRQDDPRVERIARALCELDGLSPDGQELGDVTVPWEAARTESNAYHDGLTDDGEPWVHRWRQYIPQAMTALLAGLLQPKRPKHETTLPLIRGSIVIADLHGSSGAETGNSNHERRICLVVQNDLGNDRSPMTIVAPITSHKGRRVDKYQALLESKEDRGWLNLSSVVHCEQLRTLDRNSRIYEVKPALSSSAMEKVDAALRVSLGLSDEASAAPLEGDQSE